jgi:ketosteroid isomerase-like protein
VRHGVIGLALFLLTACKREASVIVIEDGAPPVVDTDTGVPKPSMELESKRLLDRWDAAYNAHDATAVAANYTPDVRWYGQTLTRDACKEKIAANIKKDQKQSSIIDEMVEVTDGARVKVTRTMTNGGKTSTQKLSFHLAKSQSGGLRIEEETDH